MKYLYLRLNDYEIITFKSVECRVEEEMIKVCFNGAEGCFIKVETTDEVKEIIDEIMYYLRQDLGIYRILDLRNYGSTM